jgi:superfamily II DNA/RNA helicase
MDVAANDDAILCNDTKLMCLLQHVLPLGAKVLINYDLPCTKEEHNRRLTKTIGSTSPEHPTGAAIHFVVSGQMAAFRSLEKLANALIHEMPVHAADILS